MVEQPAARGVSVDVKFFLTIVVTALVFGQSADAARPDSARVPTILVFGDSLSDGFGLRRSEAYPSLLTEKLRAAGLTYEVTNASASGGTTEGGLRRLGPQLRRHIDVFVLELGINDVFRGVPLEQIRSNLQEIIDRVREKNPRTKMVVVGMQLPDAGNDYLSAFGQMFAEIANKNNAALVPSLLEGVAGDPGLNLPDRVHPNAAGHRILAENVWRVLEPVVRKAREKSPALL